MSVRYTATSDIRMALAFLPLTLVSLAYTAIILRLTIDLAASGSQFVSIYEGLAKPLSTKHSKTTDLARILAVFFGD